MKRSRVVSALATVMLAGGSLVLFAAPASAQNGPPEVGCTTGSSCMIELNYDVTYTGSSGGDNGVVIPPPPCIGVPFGDAHTGSQAIINLLYNNNAPVSQPSSPPPAVTASPTSAVSGSSPSPTFASGTATATPTTAATPTPTIAASTTAPPPAPDLNAQQRQILSQAKQLVNTKPMASGEWYQVTGDPYATSTAQQRCNNLPPYIWVPGGSNLRVDGVNIPPSTLAGLAYSQLTTAQFGKLTLNPQGTSDTNLPTFVDAALQPPARGVLSVTANGNPYVWATATTPDGESATVWAWVTGLTISPGTANATTFNQQRCSVAHLSADGHTFVLGSRYSTTEMTQVGVGQQIDCGVTYTAPGRYALAANVTWDACWAPGLATTDGPPRGCKPVPGAAGLAASTSAPDRVNVREIQSVNNG